MKFTHIHNTFHRKVFVTNKVTVHPRPEFRPIHPKKKGAFTALTYWVKYNIHITVYSLALFDQVTWPGWPLQRIHACLTYFMFELLILTYFSLNHFIFEHLAIYNILRLRIGFANLSASVTISEHLHLKMIATLKQESKRITIILLGN